MRSLSAGQLSLDQTILSVDHSSNWVAGCEWAFREVSTEHWDDPITLTGALDWGGERHRLFQLRHRRLLPGRHLDGQLAVTGLRAVPRATLGNFGCKVAALQVYPLGGRPSTARNNARAGWKDSFLMPDSFARTPHSLAPLSFSLTA